MADIVRIRDPIHGFISLTPKERLVVNSPIFQRLRGIRQLALAYLVYPGALHTRFDHSLGVCHVAGKVAKDQLHLDEGDQELVRLAALLHDVGHGPFSHVSEGALELFADKAKVGSRITRREKIHELVTQDLIRTVPILTDVLGARTISDIVQLLSQGYGEPILRSIVSGPLDADKQDYLLRDSYYCGVNYGVFDIHQLIRSLRSIPDSTLGRQLGIASDGVHSLEQFVLAKYYLTTQVYGHKVRIITDQMIQRAISLGISQDGILAMHDIYAYDGTQKYLENYVSWDDARFLMVFSQEKYGGKLSYEIVRRLRSRDLFKRVYTSRLSSFSPDVRDLLSEISDPSNAEKRATLEASIGAILERERVPLAITSGDLAKFVILHTYRYKSVKEQSRDDEASIIVLRDPPKPFEEESVLFHSIDESLNEAYVEVFAPVRYDTHVDRQRFLNRLRGAIEAVLGESGRSEGGQHADA